MPKNLTKRLLQGLLLFIICFFLPIHVQAQPVSMGEQKLSGLELKLYRRLKQNIQDTASGKRPDSSYDVSDIIHTTAEIEQISKNIQSINNCLLNDLPYDLYWYDKSTKNKFPDTESAIRLTYGTTETGQTVNVHMAFLVSMDYRDTSDPSCTKLNQDMVRKAEAARQYAIWIINENRDKSDYDKLQAYRQVICDAVSYDTGAVSANPQPDNPWQPICVFDQDPDTNPVCEGYAKAFQYLCDLSAFQDVTCYTVTGNTDSILLSDYHMWNIVRIADDSYLVDLTNCDEGTVGHPDGLFLKAPSSGTWDGSYTFPAGITYRYEPLMYELFDPSILSLAANNYQPTINAKPANNTQKQTEPSQAQKPGNKTVPEQTKRDERQEKPESKKKETKTKTDKKSKTKEISKEQVKASQLKVKSLDPSDHHTYKLIQEELKSATIKEQPKSAKELRQALTENLSELHDLKKQNIQIQELTLVQKTENDTWQPVEPKDFPKKGIQITIPYPNNTNADEYLFYGQHLFTKDTNGYKAGETENLSIEKTENGLTFITHGLSPVSIGYQRINFKPKSIADTTETIKKHPNYAIPLILTIDAFVFGFGCCVWDTYKRKQNIKT